MNQSLVRHVCNLALHTPRVLLQAAQHQEQRQGLVEAEMVAEGLDPGTPKLLPTGSRRRKQSLDEVAGTADPLPPQSTARPQRRVSRSQTQINTVDIKAGGVCKDEKVCGLPCIIDVLCAPSCNQNKWPWTTRCLHLHKYY